MAGEEAPPEGFSGGAAGILAHGLPVGRALPAQRLEPHRICGQGVGQVLGRLLAARGQQHGHQDGSASDGRLRSVVIEVDGLRRVRRAGAQKAPPHFAGALHSRRLPRQFQ